MKDTIVIATHSGRFHTDDVCAVATLFLMLEKNYKIEIIRTRDVSEIEKADYIVDFGFVYDPALRKFDHHQKEGAGKRENGIPYASFGLVWKEYGELLTGDREIVDEIDRELVQPIDAFDNGIYFTETSIEGLYMPTIRDIVTSYRSTWKEGGSEMDANFLYLVDITKHFIERKIKVIKDKKESTQYLKQEIANIKDKRLLIIDKPYDISLVNSINKNILLICYPIRQDNTWGVKCVRVDEHSYKTNFLFPEEWAGRTQDELVKVTGVVDIVFCHRDRFLVVTKTKESAIKVAELALEISSV